MEIRPTSMKTWIGISSGIALPTLWERWPQTDRALARSAALLAEDAELLGDEARRRLHHARGPEATTL